MGLSLVIEKHLEDAGLIAFYDGESAPWKKLARETYDFVKNHFPEDAKIRRDDVSEALVSYLQVAESLTDFLKEHKLPQKYWFVRFADLVIDRTWDEISTKGAHVKQDKK
jgi:hypothetical protein